MMYMAPIQMLTLWDQLHAAKNGTNKYGGDVAEIYIYSVMPHSPSFAKNPDSSFCKDEAIQANKSIYDLCKMFEYMHDKSIELEDGRALETLLSDTPNTWRMALRVKEMK